ncbi:sulfite exporter TauE/SafE family protein [Variovorax rhizosphaerae]|uniref:Sulfite exporter TauE/SafE family protein n=1 Tax=Variovorax rhizosphaerae TaxID=1836200 RepID=A0ABU8WT11_9BURK
MQAGLASAALLMGLAGGPHCVAMCGAPAAGVIRLVRGPLASVESPSLLAPASKTLVFHAGRAVSYATAGALVAGAVQSLADAGEHVAALKPLWVLLHAATLAWGLALIVQGRQPNWAHRFGKGLAGGVRPHTRSAFGVLAMGALWVLMPCGLLYSALALASLGNGALDGAMVMVLFALGSGVSLVAAPWALQVLGNRLGPSREGWGARIAGGLLALLALQALWLDFAQGISDWCR